MIGRHEALKNANQELDLLDKFRRHELAAVETYSQLMERLNGSASIGLLGANRASHANRSALLADEIQRRGGEPSEHSGVWGALTRLLEGGAGMFGEKAAMQMLEEGEDHGCRLYDDGFEDYSAEFRALVTRELREPQQSSHDALASVVNG
mgnify:CR=1 FL=1